MSQFDRLSWTSSNSSTASAGPTGPSAKDIRYILDYVVNWYMSWFLRMTNDGIRLGTDQVQLSSEGCAQGRRGVGAGTQYHPHTDFRYRTMIPFSMIFTKKQLALWRKKCRRCLIENAHIRR